LPANSSRRGTCTCGSEILYGDLGDGEEGSGAQEEENSAGEKVGVGVLFFFLTNRYFA
jgi:hypothetical protein